MNGTMFTDMRHFLEEDGSQADLTPLGERLFRYFQKIIAGAILAPEGAVAPTGVKCRRRPGRRPCPGVIDAVWEYEDGQNVTWECPECGDNGHISGIPDESEIEGTDEPLDDSGDSAQPMQLLNAQPEFSTPAKRIWESLDFGVRVKILNRVHCVNCPRPVAMQLQHGKVEKGDLVLHGRCLECGGEVARLVEVE